MTYIGWHRGAVGRRALSAMLTSHMGTDSSHSCSGSSPTPSDVSRKASGEGSSAVLPTSHTEGPAGPPSFLLQPDTAH